MNDKINCAIKNLKREETIRIIKLGNKRKGELKISQKIKDDVMNYVNNFQSELNELSTVYDGLNTKDSHTFISQVATENYNLIEEDLNETINELLHNIKGIQSSICKLENKYSCSILENDYKTSLYLKYDAKMQEIEAKAELASLEAEIEYLTLNKDDKVMFGNNLERQTSDIVNEIEHDLKDLLNTQTTLELRTYILAELRVQQESTEMIADLLETLQRQLVRGKMRLAALNVEFTTHVDLLAVLESIPYLQSSLVAICEQLNNLERIMMETEEPSSINDENLLRKLKEQPSKSLEPLVAGLNDVNSVLLICEQQKKMNKTLIWAITDSIENSKCCLDNINKNVELIYGDLKDKRALGDSPRLSLVEQCHQDEYTRLQDESRTIQDKLKKLKLDKQLLSVDVEL